MAENLPNNLEAAPESGDLSGDAPRAFEAASATAVFSADRTRRYRLTRHWTPLEGQDEKSLGFVMLNPSSADAVIE